MEKKIRTSVIWKISRHKFEEIVKKNNSLSDILKHFGLVNKGGNFQTLKRRLEEDKIDFSHIPLGNNSNKGRKFYRKKVPLEEIMIENSTYCRQSLKKRLLENGILKNECYICGQEPIHNGKKLVMILDHINGISNDNRLENLRVLCPNCNSQQDTFAGRNNKREKKKFFCKECKIDISKGAKLCVKCIGFTRRKANRPSREILEKEVKELGYCAVGRNYGVSDNSIRKWLSIKIS